MLFATPDFGAGACIFGLVLLAWAVALILVFVGLSCGAGLVGKGSAKARKWGIILMGVSGLVPLACWLGPSQAVRISYGNYPIANSYKGKIHKGMTAEEVVKILGTPHEKYPRDRGESWYYYLDSFGIGWFCVQVGPDGKVSWTHEN